MRITHRSVALTSLRGLNGNLEAVGKLQQQLTSGKVLSKPSDSPTGVNRAMLTRSDQAATDLHARSITDAKGWLDRADTVLQTMLGVTTDVRNLAIRGMNSGATSVEAAGAISKEVANLRENLLALANQDVQGRPIFGGATSGGKAYDPAGAWVGRDGLPVLRRVSDTETVRVDVTGPEAFGDPARDLFAIVGDISADVVANPAALAGHLAALDGVFNRMMTAVTDIGARSARIDQAEQVNFDRGLILENQLAQTESVDLPKVIMDLQMRQTGYEAALKATAQSLQPTLLDFLR